MNNRQLYQWVKRERKGWGEVNRHFRANVVVFSRGVVAAQSSQIRKIAGCVGGRSDSQRRRLQRYVAQTGSLRGFFKAWTRSMVKALGVTELVLAVDETKLRDTLAVMVVGVVYAGRCLALPCRLY